MLLGGTLPDGVVVSRYGRQLVWCFDSVSVRCYECQPVWLSGGRLLGGVLAGNVVSWWVLRRLAGGAGGSRAKVVW